MRTPVEFPPSAEHIRVQKEEARLRWSHLAERGNSEEVVANAYAEIQAAGHEISGTTRDAQQRAVLYFAIYEDSERNFLFPLIASHGSMWGVRHLEWIDQSFVPLQRWSRHGRVQRWREALDAVRDVNRRVFREIYTTFYFTRYFGEHPAADRFVKPPILARYNQAHQAVRNNTPLTREERREAYYEVFVHEQNDIVDPGLKDASAAAGRALTELTKRVSPRFKYFPGQQRLWFTDFTDVHQRNREGLRALDFAEDVGAEAVLRALANY